MNITQAFLLGAIQGLTEFLPVSSSGHLVILSSFIKAENNLTFDISVHFASLIAIFIFFYKDITAVLKDLRERKLAQTTLFKIVLASIPAFLVGFFLNDAVESLFQNPSLAASMLYVTAGILFLAEISGRKAVNQKRDFSLRDALLVGAFQALAIVPGISRSGSTIAAGIFSGHSRESSARFSFLLAIPAISGAMLLDIFQTGFSGIFSITVLTGFISSFVFSYLALKVLFAALRRYSLYPFAAYCFAVTTIYFIFR